MSTTLQRFVSAVLLAGALLLAARVQGQATGPVAPPEHVRGAEQTLLTFPEWFLVFSPHEYAEFTAKQPPSRFPWWGHIGQFWQSYFAVTDETRRREMDLNAGYHLMIMVIGTSTTVEYALRSGYEMLVGRMAEATASAPTAEDQLAARVAREYVDFIRVLPWYEFDFAARLRRLWTETGWWGEHPLRKWERKFALTTEYGIKMLYGQLIKLGTQSAYETPLLVTAMVTRPAPVPDPKLPDLKVLSALPDGRALITVPRYEAFMTYAQALAARGHHFEEIAGNRHLILVSLLARSDWLPAPDTPVLFAQPILTQPGRQRVALMVPVSSLAQLLRTWSAAGVQVEHLFDY